MIRKLPNRVGIAAIGDVHDTATVDVDEQGYIVMAALGGRLVDADALEVREIRALQGFLDVMKDDAPHPRIMLADKARNCRDRHVPDKRHGVSFKQQCEARAGSRPRHGDLLHAARRTFDARRAGRKECLMLKEVQVTPRLHDRIVRRTVRGLAIRARKTTAGREVDLQIEALLVGIEFSRLDQPRRHKAKRKLEQVCIAHGSLKSKFVTPIAVAGPERLASFPDVATFTEQGLPDMQILAWGALFAPAGTPQPIIEKLNAAAKRMLDTEEVEKFRIATGGARANADLAISQAFVSAEIARWEQFVRLTAANTCRRHHNDVRSFHSSGNSTTSSMRRR